MQAPRLLPDHQLPPFAYVPGRQVRPGQEHVVQHVSAPRQFAWGFDLFNRGFYWEAHEAWEGLWARSRRGSRRRLLLKGLILLAAAGVKARQSRGHGVARHAARAEALFRQLAAGSGGTILGLCPANLAGLAKGVQDGADAAGHDQDGAAFGVVLAPGPRFARLCSGAKAPADDSLQRGRP